MAPKQIKYDATAMQWKADESAVNELANIVKWGYFKIERYVHKGLTHEPFPKP